MLGVLPAPSHFPRSWENPVSDPSTEPLNEARYGLCLRDRRLLLAPHSKCIHADIQDASVVRHNWRVRAPLGYISWSGYSSWWLFFRHNLSIALYLMCKTKFMLNPCVLPTVHEQHEIYHKANQHRAMPFIADGFQHTSLWSNQTWSPFYIENPAHIKVESASPQDLLENWRIKPKSF